MGEPQARPTDHDDALPLRVRTLGRNCLICAASRSTLLPAASAVTSYRSGRSAQMSSVCVPIEPVDPSSEILRCYDTPHRVVWRYMSVRGVGRRRRTGSLDRSVGYASSCTQDQRTFLSGLSARSTVCLNETAVLTAMRRGKGVAGKKGKGSGAGSSAHQLICNG